MLKAKTPKLIPISDQPIKLGGKVRHLTPEQVSKLLEEEFKEEVIIGADLSLDSLDPKDNITSDLSKIELVKGLEKIMETPREDLCLRKMDDRVGYGVFALRDIGKNEVLCFYSGTLIIGQQAKSANDYLFGYHSLNISFSTRYFRGIASFFQHLPLQPKIADPEQLQSILQLTGQNVSLADLKLNDELYSIEFHDSQAQKNLATANLRFEYINYKGFPLILIVTTCSIKAGEIMGFQYGKDYWNSRREVPRLFTKQGELIPKTAYQRNLAKLYFDGGFTYTGDLVDFRKHLVAGKPTICLKADDGSTRAVNSGEVLEELIAVNGLSEATIESYFKSKYKVDSSTDPYGEKRLRMAANNGQLADLRVLIKAGTEVNAQDTNPKSKKTAIHWAANKKHKDCCLLLLKAGADPRLKDANGDTAIRGLKELEIPVDNFSLREALPVTTFASTNEAPEESKIKAEKTKFPHP